MENSDSEVVRDFGNEWRRFDQSGLSKDELQRQFNKYFGIFPWQQLPSSAIGFDLGCGSGRWAKLVAERVGHLHCIDASAEALEVARGTLYAQANCSFVCASVDNIPLDDASQDFGYSLGVLHHVPDTLAGLSSCAAKLKSGAPFLVYLYYSLDNRPVWYRWLWYLTDYARRGVSVLPRSIKAFVCDLIAALVYWPLARFARLMDGKGLPSHLIPLSHYRTMSFYTMRTDALDRFGTRLEQRFSRSQIETMMRQAGFRDVTFSETDPYWCAVGRRV